MAGNLECTCPYDRSWTDRTSTTPGCPTHDPDGYAELGLIDMLEVLALTQVALDTEAPKSHRMAARFKVAKLLGLNNVKLMP